MHAVYNSLLQGLEFLSYAVDPKVLGLLSEEDFQNLKTEMNQCVCHVIGEKVTPTPVRSCLTIKGTGYKRCRVWTQIMLSNKKARVWDVQGMQILHPDHTYQ